MTSSGKSPSPADEQNERISEKDEEVSEESPPVNKQNPKEKFTKNYSKPGFPPTGKRPCRKRRHSTSEDFPLDKGQSSFKQRRQGVAHKSRASGDIILPNKFLLGGNITDPLNLNSMLDEKVNRALNAVTPSSSPLPPRNSTINIIIPSDMTDPLGLLAASSSNIKTTRTKDIINAPIPVSNLVQKKKRKHDNNTGDGVGNNKVEQIKERKISTEKSEKSQNKEGAAKLTIPLPQFSDIITDPIVSPVVPQDVRRSSILFSPKNQKRKASISKQQAAKNSSDKNNSDVIVPNKDANKTFDDDKKLTSTINSVIEKPKDNALKQKTNSPINPAVNSMQKQQNYKKMKFSKKNEKFQYGNYRQYYGYRNQNKFQDERMSCLKKEWFKDKDVLDVGCNSGHLTILIARDYEPRKIVGIDIDEVLIHNARKNTRHYVTDEARPPSATLKKYPDSMAKMFGPIVGPAVETAKDDTTKFPNNVVFLQGNYVPLKEELVKYQEPEYDVIVCMSVTKWIHLNWGDEGLKNTFERFFRQLRPGGKLIMEPQAWKSYMKKKKITERIFKNYSSIQLLPKDFSKFLIQKIGFESVEYLEMPVKNVSKGFQRQIHMYYKPE